MSIDRKTPTFIALFSISIAIFAHGQDAPEKALKYQEALLKRPHNDALFDRFFGAWIDEQPIETLDAYLKVRAQSEGGVNWTVLATYQLRRGNETEALAALAKSIEAIPDDPALPMERAKLLLRRLEFDAARTDLAAVVAGKDEILVLEAAKLIGKSWLREGKTEEAIQAWDAVLAAHPEDEDLLEDLVETAAAESENAQALIYIDKLIEASRDPYQKTLRMLRRGDLLSQAGRKDEAVEAYGKTFNQVGEGSWLEREVLAQIEKLFRSQDRVDDLSAQLKKLAETYPQRLLIQRQLAKLEAAQGETDSAIGRFREVLKRSPGERELREEFVRLLSDGERFDDAVAELEKLIELAPTDSSLHLQIAALRFRQNKPEPILTALQRAHELLGKDEGSGVRIAGLMLQYNLLVPGETLLKELASAATASPSTLEALASHYGRTERKAEAIALFKKAGASAEVDVLIRTSGAISALGDSAIAYESLAAQVGKFTADPRYLAALSQAAVAAQKAPEAIPHVLKLVRLAKQTTELSESISLASRVINGADKLDEVRTSLTEQASRTPSETCLLASLLEDGGDVVGVGKLLDNATDSLVIHFHAALLDRRGEFDAAITTLSLLAATDEGKKAAFFKDLSELQQRAGKIPEALATVERWKLGAPGDKTAWITGSRLLRESGKPDEAVKMTRQAVARFEGDNDLAASLAQLHEESGQWQDSEAIYWKLYDEAQSPTDQARWAVQLAQLAQRTGKTDDMEEKLRERARSNRRSLGPILALAELARITQNEDKRRDLLLEAVRLQPKDIDLRLQISSLEEQSGNPDRVVAILEEALPFDNNGRIRSSLAQAYLRQGQTLKGLRELRLLAGKTGFDIRSAESAAAALAENKLYDEGISLLRTELPSGGDWRSQYLLGVMLEEDGRETEAYPVFLSILQAGGEIPGLVKPNPNPAIARMTQGSSPYSPQVQALMGLNSANQFAYQHRKSNSNHGGFYSQNFSKVGAFWLPNTPDDARKFAQIHLAALSKKNKGEVDEALRTQLKAAGMNDPVFISEFVAASNTENQSGLYKLLETYPDEPGFFEFLCVSYGMYQQQPMDEKLIRHALQNEAKLSPLARFSAWTTLALAVKPEDPAWASMLAAAQNCIDEKSQHASQTVLYRLMYLLQGQQGTCPEIHRPAVQKLMLAAYAKMTKDSSNPYQSYYAMGVFSSAGDANGWIEAINSTIREFRKNPSQMTQMGARTRLGQILRYTSQYASRGSNYWQSEGNLFEIPSLETMPTRSIPAQVMHLFTPNSNYRGKEKPLLTPLELLKKLDRFESPFLRAWLAAKSGDREALTAALKAVPTAQEECDFKILNAIIAIQNKKLADAFNSLLEARPLAGSDREIAGWINLSLITLAENLSPEERAKVGEQVQAAFLQSRQLFGQQGAATLAAQARKLGLEELAKRIEPAATVAGKAGAASTAPAALAGAAATSSRSSSRSSGGSPEKVQKFVTEKKYEAAAREVLLAIRGQTSNRSSYYYSHELPQLLKALGKDGQTELIKLIEPGDSKSLVKRLEYVDICSLLGKSEAVIKELESLAKERPSDTGIAARQAFALPHGQVDRQVELLNLACKSEEFVDQVNRVASRLDDSDSAKESIRFFETVTRWLENANPTELEAANLTWVAYYAKSFFEGSMTSDLSSLLGDRTRDSSDKLLTEQYQALGARLARAMMRHGNISEEGFRLLFGAKSWKLELKEMDEWARTAFRACAALKPSGIYRNGDDCFTLRMGNGGSSSGADLKDFSSGAYLGKRFRDLPNRSELLTPEFVESINQSNPAAGTLVNQLVGDIQVSDLKTLWNSELIKSNQGRLSASIRELVLARISGVASASKFFIDEINLIPAGQAVPENNNGSPPESTQLLFAVALQSAATGKPGELENVAIAISKAIFGEKIEFTEKSSRNNRAYYQVNLMEDVVESLSGNLPLLVRAHAVFFNLGLPVDSSEYSVYGNFQNRSFKTAEEAIAFFDSLGWLTEVDRWQPLACIIYQTGNSSNGISVTLEPRFVFEQAIRNLRFESEISKNIIKQLKERKTGRFGSLVIAGFLSSGSERSALIGQAFTDSKSALAKLSPKRIDELSLLMPWIPQEVKAKLPDSFQNKLKNAETKKAEVASKAADEFITNLKNARGSDQFDEAKAIFNTLITSDMDKAVELFCTVEQAYTASLSNGGRYSNSSSGDWQYSVRDYAFGQFTRTDSESSPFAANSTLHLGFIRKILATPTGKRLSWMDSNYSDRNIFSLSVGPLLPKFERNTQTVDGVLTILAASQKLPSELKSTALPGFLLANMNVSRKLNLKQRQEFLPKMATAVGTDPLAARIGTMRLALWSWEVCSPEEKTEIRKTFCEILADESLADIARVFVARAYLKSIPNLGLLDKPVCKALTKLYQDYCAGERTAVSQASDALFAQFTSSPPRDEASVTMCAALSKAFWDNASIPKAAGHPPIPGSLAQSSFILALAGNDLSSVAKIFPRIKTSQLGKLVPTVKLAQLDQPDLAKQLVPLPAEPFVVESGDLVYTRELEASIVKLKEAGFDALALLKLEIEMLKIPLGKNAEAPTESIQDRTVRLTSRFVATPPTGKAFPVALQPLIQSEPVPGELLPLLDDWVKKNPLRDFIGRDYTGSNSTGHIHFGAAYALHSTSIMNAFAKGDHAPLKMLQEAANMPINDRNNGNYQLYQDLQIIFQEMGQRIWIDICLDNTTAYKNGLAAWNDMIVSCAEGINDDNNEWFDNSLAISHFLACWTGELATFEEMCKKLTGKPAVVAKEFDRENGFNAFKDLIAGRLIMDMAPANVGRRVFLEKVFSNRGFVGTYPQNSDWIRALADNNYSEILMTMMENPPATLIPEVVTPLNAFRARQLREKNPQEAIFAYRKTLEGCQADPSYASFRGYLKLEYSALLENQKQPDEAKAAVASITPAEIPDKIRTRYIERAKKLGVPPVVAPSSSEGNQKSKDKP